MLAEVPYGSVQDWERDVRSDARVLLGAFDGERLLGIATATLAADDADVLLVVVDPAERRTGVGTALVTTLCRTLAALGARRALLEVRAANTAALGLYATLGFTEVARRRSYYRDGEDAVVLARELPAPT